ncbi:MAG: hypothetical protein LBE84_03985 [Planctomycetota bacterium]|jgi:hypothetical protein|nr:hypothetical protein [Planctomycetota bacterium]
MSSGLAAIQDSLVKTSLVQQVQGHNEGVSNGQEIAHAAVQRELDREEDQVVISLRQKEEHGIRQEEERNPDGGGKKRDRNGGSGKNSENGEEEPGAERDREKEAGMRPVMHRINIVV